MTVSLASAGTPTGAAASATAPAPVFPATVTAGQYAVMVVNIKLWSATCATPSGWTALGDSTNGSTDGVVNTGSTRVAVFGKTCDGTEDGTTVTLTITGGNSCGAVIHTFDTSLGGWDTPVVAFGSKVGNSANMSAASTTQTSVAAGDLFVIGYSANASLGTPSADTLTQTGVTFGTVTNRSDVAITTGNDSRNRVDTVPVTSVTTPSGGATAGYTNASSTSGTVAFVRLRDITSSSSVTPDDSAHAHTADSPALVQQNELAPVDSAHAHAADQPTLVQQNNLQPDDSFHAHTADQPAVSIPVDVTPVDSVHGHTADSPLLTVSVNLTPDDSFHDHASDSAQLFGTPLPTPGRTSAPGAVSRRSSATRAHRTALPTEVVRTSLARASRTDPALAHNRTATA